MKHFLIIAILALLCGCTGATQSAGEGANPELDAIEHAMAAGKLDKAQKLCDSFLKKNVDLDTRTLCRMAMVLTQLAENDELNDENTAQAVLCYRTAMERDSVGAMAYFTSLPTDEYKHVYMLRELLRRITDREQGVVYTDEDEYDHTDEEHE